MLIRTSLIVQLTRYSVKSSPTIKQIERLFSSISRMATDTPTSTPEYKPRYIDVGHDAGGFDTLELSSEI